MAAPGLSLGRARERRPISSRPALLPIRAAFGREVLSSVNNRSALLIVSFIAALLLTSLARAEQRLIQNEHEAKWSDAPPMLPAGAKIDVVQGDPRGTGLYTARLKFPANYRIPAHSHPTDEHVTVLSGTLYVGMGDRLDPKVGTALTVGGFALMPAKMNHYAYTRKPTTILLHGMGPVEFIYVNPADDPRNAGQALRH